MPSQFFLYECEGPPPSPPLHLLSTQVPVWQSALVSHAAAASHVPSLHSRPSLHSPAPSQAWPHSLVPCLDLSWQPGKSGGHSSLATQRAGASAPEYANGSAVLVSLATNSIGFAFEPNES